MTAIDVEAGSVPLEPPTAFLAVRDLRVHFPTEDGLVKSVDGVTFSLEKGSTLGIVGESGCGKSVTSQAILGLHKGTRAQISGQIWLDGEELVSASGEYVRKLRGNKMSMIFQDPLSALHPFYSIGDQIVEAYRIYHKVSKKDAWTRTVDMLDRVGIPNPAARAKDYPHQFSGGMRQRAMIAMALSLSPKLIIADEPTTALDVTIQAQILELMKDLTRRLNVALIIITHNLGVVARYANRVNVMYAGRLVESGPAADVYHNPRHPYTMALLRSVPRLDRPRQERLDPVEGQPPDLTRLDGGCAFRPRCRFAVDACAAARPPLEHAGGPGHLAACFQSHVVGRETGAAA